MPHDDLCVTVPGRRIDAVPFPAVAAIVPVTEVRRRPSPLTQLVDVRAVHARRLWDSGWGHARFQNFATYLLTIPPIPRPPVDVRFASLVLVDTSMRLTDACRVLGLAYGGDDTVFEKFGSSHRVVVPVLAEVYWMWVQDGAENCGRTPFACVHGFAAPNEAGLTAFEGVCFYALHPGVLGRHAIDCAASRLGSHPAYNACLQIGDDGAPSLGVAEYCVAGPRRGAASKWV